MVEVVISLAILCGGNYDGSLLEGFTLCFLDGRLLTINGNHTRLYLVLWGCCVCFQPPFGHCISFSPGRGIFLQYFHHHNWLWGGHYAKKYVLGLLVVPRLCISINIVRLLGKNVRVMPLRILGVGYCLVRNLCSSASWPTLPGVEMSPYFTKIRVIRLVVPP
jgi:hypothetical protein